MSRFTSSDVTFRQNQPSLNRLNTGNNHFSDQNFGFLGNSNTGLNSNLSSSKIGTIGISQTRPGIKVIDGKTINFDCIAASDSAKNDQKTLFRRRCEDYESLINRSIDPDVVKGLKNAIDKSHFQKTVLDFPNYSHPNLKNAENQGRNQGLHGSSFLNTRMMDDRTSSFNQQRGGLGQNSFLNNPLGGQTNQGFGNNNNSFLPNSQNQSGNSNVSNFFSRNQTNIDPKSNQRDFFLSNKNDNMFGSNRNAISNNNGQTNSFFSNQNQQMSQNSTANSFFDPNKSKSNITFGQNNNSLGKSIFSRNDERSNLNNQSQQNSFFQNNNGNTNSFLNSGSNQNSSNSFFGNQNNGFQNSQGQNNFFDSKNQTGNNFFSKDSTQNQSNSFFANKGSNNSSLNLFGNTNNQNSNNFFGNNSQNPNNFFQNNSNQNQNGHFQNPSNFFQASLQSNQLMTNPGQFYPPGFIPTGPITGIYINPNLPFDPDLLTIPAFAQYKTLDELSNKNLQFGGLNSHFDVTSPLLRELEDDDKKSKKESSYSETIATELRDKLALYNALESENSRENVSIRPFDNFRDRQKQIITNPRSYQRSVKNINKSTDESNITIHKTQNTSKIRAIGNKNETSKEQNIVYYSVIVFGQTVHSLSVKLWQNATVFDLRRLTIELLLEKENSDFDWIRNSAIFIKNEEISDKEIIDSIINESTEIFLKKRNLPSEIKSSKNLIKQQVEVQTIPEEFFPIMTSNKLTITPSIEKMRKMNLNLLKNLPGLIIENEYGKAEFPEKVDVTGFNFDEWILLEDHQFEIYPDELFKEFLKPKWGTKLNKSIIVTLNNFDFRKSDVDLEYYIEKLKKWCFKNKTEFSNYSPDNCKFTFKVKKSSHEKS